MKWVFVALLAVQAHFAASYLVPLDEQAQRTFGGLLRWAWPWAIGDRGPLGRMTSSGFPLPGFFLAVTAIPGGGGIGGRNPGAENRTTSSAPGVRGRRLPKARPISAVHQTYVELAHPGEQVRRGE